jgi:hypothetical protein
VQVTTAFLEPSERICCGSDFLSSVDRCKMWADPARQSDGSALGLHALYRKQLQSIGVPPWPLASPALAPRTARDKSRPFGDYISTLPAPSTITMYAMTTDGGADQVKLRAVIKHETRYHRGCLIIDASCLHHNNQLVTKSGLLTMDRWLTRHDAPFMFYSSVAKTVHVWRDMHRRVYATFVSMFGAQLGNSVAKSLVPRCLSGRWGSMAATLCRILAAGQRELTRALLWVLRNRIVLFVGMCHHVYFKTSANWPIHF